MQQKQQQVSTTSGPSTPDAQSSSSLVAARVDHCYIMNSPSGEPPTGAGQAEQLRQVGGGNCLGVSSTSSLPDREQLQMLLESRPQPISCPLGESPLIAVMNSKSQEPLSQSKGAGKRRQSQGAASTTTSGPKRARQANQEAAGKRAGQSGAKVETSSSWSGPGAAAISTTAPATRNNNAKRAETMALASAGGSKSLARPARVKKTGAANKRGAREPAEEPRQVSGQVSPTLSAGSSSGVSSLSSFFSNCSNQSDEPAGPQDERTPAADSQAGQTAAGKRRRQAAGQKRQTAAARRTTGCVSAGQSNEEEGK